MQLCNPKDKVHTSNGMVIHAHKAPLPKPLSLNEVGRVALVSPCKNLIYCLLTSLSIPQEPLWELKDDTCHPEDSRKHWKGATAAKIIP